MKPIKTPVLAHTPGPWEESQMTMGFIVGGDGNYVARTDFPHRTSSGDNTFNANARLIAAAPELLAALRKLDEVATRTTASLIAFDGADELDAAIDDARSVISKAEAR